jgi:hypothetical protein
MIPPDFLAICTLAATLAALELLLGPTAARPYLTPRNSRRNGDGCNADRSQRGEQCTRAV